MDLIAGLLRPGAALGVVGFAAAGHQAVLVKGRVAALDAWAGAAQGHGAAVVCLHPLHLSCVFMGVLAVALDAAMDARQAV